MRWVPWPFTRMLCPRGYALRSWPADITDDDALRELLVLNGG